MKHVPEIPYARFQRMAEGFVVIGQHLDRTTIALAQLSESLRLMRGRGYPKGKIKRGQGGRRKRSRRNCRRYPVDLSYYAFARDGHEWFWYMAEYPEDGSCGPFDSEREARADARRRES